MAWALTEHAELGQRFHSALAVARRERWTRIGGQTYQGFLKALVRWTPELRLRLAMRLRQTMHGQHTNFPPKVHSLDKLRGGGQATAMWAAVSFVCTFIRKVPRCATRTLDG